ncbi:MAG: DASS family sodium-coupled anion symporter [Armatimonadetes bacterium]|nr:DASS family sodium-coupled anion symporter [Armatimonadota bacterium]
MLGVVTFVLLLLLPLNLPAPQHRLLALLALTFTYWVTEALPLPVTALLAMLMCTVLGILPAKQAFAPLGNPIIFLFLGAFLLAEAVKIHELDRRWVEWFLSREWIAKTPFRILVGFGVSATAISGWMSNTATTATLYPLAWQTFQELKTRLTRPESFGVAVMLICAYSSSIGGIITPVGTPPNLIGIGFLMEQANVRIGFLQWTAAIAPVSIAMLICLMLVAGFRTRTSLIENGGTFSLTPKRLGTPLTKGEKNTIIAFGTTVGLWVLSGVAALLLEQKTLFAVIEQNATAVKQVLSFLKELPEAIPALVGAVILFVLPAEEGKPTLGWKDAQRIDWGTILLFAGGLTLGDAIFQTGLAERIGELITKLPFAETQLGLTIWGTAIAVGFTELVSNTAAANILAPIILATAKEAQISPILPVIGTVLGCSLSFMLPIATPPHAIVYASGLVPVRQMMLWGLILDIASPLVIVSVLWLTSPLLGL